MVYGRVIQEKSEIMVIDHGLGHRIVKFLLFFVIVVRIVVVTVIVTKIDVGTQMLLYHITIIGLLLYLGFLFNYVAIVTGMVHIVRIVTILLHL